MWNKLLPTLIHWLDLNHRGSLLVIQCNWTGGGGGGAQQWLQEEQTGAVCENKLLYSRTAQGAVFNDIPSRLPPPPYGGATKNNFQFDYGVKYRLLKRG